MKLKCYFHPEHLPEYCFRSLQVCLLHRSLSCICRCSAIMLCCRVPSSFFANYFFYVCGQVFHPPFFCLVLSFSLYPSLVVDIYFTTFGLSNQNSFVLCISLFASCLLLVHVYGGFFICQAVVAQLVRA